MLGGQALQGVERQEQALAVLETQLCEGVVRSGGEPLSAGLAADRQAVTAALERADIDPTRRAETLSLDEWAALTNVLEPPTF